MSLLDFLTPLKRRPILWVTLLCFITLSLFSIASYLPNNQKITIYFTVVPQESNTTSLDPIESGMKVAETMSGWAKNPRFRADILEAADLDIPDFKKRITARKQNRMNVFWTIKLPIEMSDQTQNLTGATLEVINQNLNQFNQDSAFPIKITPPQTFVEPSHIPWSWSLGASIFLAFFSSLLLIYLIESLRAKVSFRFQITEIFPESPCLQISEKLGKHDQKLLERFILTFDTPRLIGTFPEAEKFFTLAAHDSFDPTSETPILLVKMGNTKISELRNLEAIFGTEIGIIIFEQ